MKTKPIGEVGLYERTLDNCVTAIDIRPDEEAASYEGLRGALIHEVETSRNLYMNGLNPGRKEV